MQPRRGQPGKGKRCRLLWAVQRPKIFALLCEDRLGFDGAFLGERTACNHAVASPVKENDVGCFGPSSGRRYSPSCAKTVWVSTGPFSVNVPHATTPWPAR